jgi:hypothetical protein
MAFAYISDKTRLRAPYLFIQAVVTIIGLVITAYHKKANIRYLGMRMLSHFTSGLRADERHISGLFLVTCGASGSIPGVLAYVRRNLSYSRTSVS